MPWSSGLDVAMISITDEYELPIISGSLYCVNESSEALKNQYQKEFSVAEMFYNNHGLANDLVDESGVLVASKFYQEVGQEDFSAVYKFYEEVIDARLIQFLNTEFNEFYKKYKNQEPQKIWKLYEFQKDHPAYRDLEWDELLSRYEFNNDPAVKGIVKEEDLEPVYKFSKEIGDIKESVEFYKPYKDLISKRSDLKLGDILKKEFYDFHNKHKSEYTMDEILDLYFNDIEIPEKSVEIYGKYKSLLSNKKLDRKNILNKNFSDFHDKAKNIGPDVVLDLYIFYDKKCPENNKPELSDIFEPYFYLILKDFETSDSQEILNVCGFYKELYLQSKVLSYHVLREYYKEIVKTYPKLRPSEVLTEDFLGFFEYKMPQHKPEPNKIWNVYKFQKGVPEYKDFGWAELSSLHNFGQQLNQKPEHQILIKLHDFYEKLPNNDKPEPQKILDFYNKCDSCNRQDLFNYEFFKYYNEHISEFGNNFEKLLGSYERNQNDVFKEIKEFAKDEEEAEKLYELFFDKKADEKCRKELLKDNKLNLLWNIAECDKNQKEVWDIKISYEFLCYIYQQNNSKIEYIENDVRNLIRFYSEVRKGQKEQEFKPADIFNPSFYDFYIKVVSVNKNFVRSDYLGLYEFYSQNIVKEEDGKLSSFYESYKTLVADDNNGILAKLVALGLKVVAPVRRFFSKNQHQLEIFEKFFEYYTNNVTKDNAKSILNKDFYEFFKKVVDAKN